MQKTLVSVIGGRSVDSGLLDAAEAIGREIARRGAVLLCGGLTGVMEAACRGAKSAGGLTIGILPTGSASDANPYIDVAIPTGIGYARNYLVATSSCGVVAVGGSLGTLSEIAFALDKGLPVAAIGSWTLDQSRLPAGVCIFETKDPAAAVAYVMERAGRIAQ